MKLAVFASLLAYAAAFAPSQPQQQARQSTTALNADFGDRAGALPPLGYWDPLNLATSERLFDKYREVELKHGRVAMLAVVGYVVPEFFRFPGEITNGYPFADIPNGVAALGAVPLDVWAFIFFLIGVVDTKGYLGDYEVGKPDLPPEILQRRQTEELNNGRLAMVAILELLRHDSQNLVQPGFDGLDNLITGLPFLYN